MFLLEGQNVYEQMCVCDLRRACVCLIGGGVICLCPIHVAFCQVLTNAFVVLPIVRLSCEFHFFMCNSHQPHHANKGKCVWKTSVFLLSPLSACDECPLMEHGVIMICDHGDILEAWRNLKVLQTTHVALVDSQWIRHPTFLRFYFKVWNERRGKRDRWRQPILATSVSLSEVSPLIKELGLIRSNFPLWNSYHLGENSAAFVCVHNLTPHHEPAS